MMIRSTRRRRILLACLLAVGLIAVSTSFLPRTLASGPLRLAFSKGRAAAFTAIQIGAATVGVPVGVGVSVSLGLGNNLTESSSLTKRATIASYGTTNSSMAAVPPVEKSFSPNEVAVNSPSTMTIVFNNPHDFALTNLGIVDNFPSGMEVDSSPAPSNTCGGTFTVGASSVNLSGASLGASPASCSVSVRVRATSGGVKINTTNTATSTESSTLGGATASLTAIEFATMSLSPEKVPVGGISTLTITFSNLGVTTLNNVSVNDPFPAGLETDLSPQSVNTCGGTLTVSQNSLFLSGGTLDGGATCAISVKVKAINPGTLVNTTDPPSSTEGGVANPASANLYAFAPPTLSMIFVQSRTPVGGTSQLTYLITNPATNPEGQSMSGVGFTHSFNGFVADDPVQLTNNCGGNLTVLPGATSIALSNVVLPDRGAQCTILFRVKPPSAGRLDNETGNITSVEGGTGATASATLTVVAPPTINKSFSPSTLTLGEASTLRFRLNNPNGFFGGDLTGLAFTDTLPAGMAVSASGPTPICGGQLTTIAPNGVLFAAGALNAGISCTIDVTVTSTQIGVWPNTTTAIGSTETGAGATSNTANLTVKAFPSVTTITDHAPEPSVTGQTYSVTVSVVPGPTYTGTPSGSVTVSDRSGGSCVLTLTGGTGSCSLTPTTAGLKTLTASYGGDANFLESSSVSVPHTVNKADTSIYINVHVPNPVVVGELLNVTYIMTAVAPGGGTVTGNVVVSDGVNSCVGTVGACGIRMFTPGLRTLTATYQGNANYNASPPSAGESHQVNKAETSTSITAHTPDPSVSGQTVTVSFSVAVVAPGSGTPTGNVVVTVSDGAETCTGTVAQGSCTLALTAPGNRTLKATYEGDAAYNGSVGRAPQTVNKGNSTTTIVSDNPDSSGVGQNVTVAYTVVATSPASGTPSGNVTVSDGVNSCTATVAAGSCVIALTTPGVRTLTASYAGDTNFEISSDTESHTVNLPQTIAKVFAPATTQINTSSTLTFTITNPATNSSALSGVAFTDNFPSANLVVANPLTLTNTCGGTLQDGAGGTLTPGDTGIRLVGGTVGSNSSCTISVRVTPLAQGPFVNVSGAVTSTNGGVGNTATATLLTNTPPTISSNTIQLKAGSAAIPLTIATAVDPDQPVNTLGFTINGSATSAFSNGVMVSNVTINALGQVSAIVLTTCAATSATFNLVVTDNQSETGSGTLTVTVTANTAPVLTYAAQLVAAGSTPVINPMMGPSDNGTIQPLQLLSIVPNNGGLQLNLNPATGQVAVVAATIAGDYTATVTAMDQCSATTQALLTIKVGCPSIVLTPATLPAGVVNVVSGGALNAMPAGGNYSFAVTSGALPVGLTLNSNGTFTGAPTQSGTFNFRVTATGFGGCTGFRDYQLQVNCPTVTLNPASLSDGTVGTPYNQVVSGLPIGSYVYAISEGSLPTGVSLNSTTGAITGSPIAAGTFTFTVLASVGGCSATRSYAVTIGCNAVTLPALASGTVGTAYAGTVAASPAGAYTYSLAGGSLPAGLTLNSSNGALTGTPAVAGTYGFTIRATTSTGCSGQQTYSLAISCPTITLSPLPVPSLGSSYNQTVTAAPAGGNFTFAVVSGSLPGGLFLNSSTGAITGTPATGGAYSFTLRATGFGGCSGTQAYTGTIANTCPTITLPALPGGQVGQAYINAVTATPSGTYSYAVTSGTLPPGLTLYGAFGLLYGYPTTPGSYSFAITATNNNNCTGSRSYVVAIGGAALGAVFGDFDGDGRTDLSVWRGQSGDWLTINSGDGQLKSSSWGSGQEPTDDVITPGDYDGDRKTDLAVFHRSTGEWLIKHSNDGSVITRTWGVGTDTPVAGDYDGDGKTDLAVWRASDSSWRIARSFDGQEEMVSFGSPRGPNGDMPVPADYDGDGKTDLAIYRQATGNWYIRLSSKGEVRTQRWGLRGDVPVVADYDGDGKADIAVWRGADTNWYVLKSSDEMMKSTSWGAMLLGDLPVPGDYDGDGKADIAIWRASDGTWHIKGSRDDQDIILSHGSRGDVPVTLRIRQ